MLKVWLYFCWICAAFFALGIIVYSSEFFYSKVENGKTVTKFSTKEYSEYAKKSKEEKKKTIDMLQMSIVLFVLFTFNGVLFGIINNDLNPPKSKSNSWDNLSEEEQEWYHRNFGNGKSEAIDKAIKDYKNK